MLGMEASRIISSSVRRPIIAFGVLSSVLRGDTVTDHLEQPDVARRPDAPVERRVIYLADWFAASETLHAGTANSLLSDAFGASQ